MIALCESARILAPMKRFLASRGLNGSRANVAGAGTNHLIGLILLNTVANPADGSPQGEKRDSAPWRQLQAREQRHQPEEDVGCSPSSS